MNINKIISILEQDKNKYGFMKKYHSDGDKKRCAIGLLLSHYGWDGRQGERWNEGKGYMARDEEIWKKMKQDLEFKKGESFGETPYGSLPISEINDVSESFDEVIDFLKKKDKRMKISMIEMECGHIWPCFDKQHVWNNTFYCQDCLERKKIISSYKQSEDSLV